MKIKIAGAVLGVGVLGLAGCSANEAEVAVVVEDTGPMSMSEAGDYYLKHACISNNADTGVADQWKEHVYQVPMTYSVPKSFRIAYRKQAKVERALATALLKPERDWPESVKKDATTIGKYALLRQRRNHSMAASKTVSDAVNTRGVSYKATERHSRAVEEIRFELDLPAGGKGCKKK